MTVSPLHDHAQKARAAFDFMRLGVTRLPPFDDRARWAPESITIKTLRAGARRMFEFEQDRLSAQL